MRIAAVIFALVLGTTTGCFSFSQFDDEEAARNRRAWVMEPEHVLDPVAYHASDVPVEGLDPPGPTPLAGPRRDPDTIPREKKPRKTDLERTEDAWERFERERGVEER